MPAAKPTRRPAIADPATYQPHGEAYAVHRVQADACTYFIERVDVSLSVPIGRTYGEDVEMEVNGADVMRVVGSSPDAVWIEVPLRVIPAMCAAMLAAYERAKASGVFPGDA